MKRLGILSLLSVFVLTSCQTFKPVPDTSLPPAKNGVYTLELEACGNTSVGTVGCLVHSNEIEGKWFKVKVPNTNDQDRLAQVRVVSRNCSVDILEQAKSGSSVNFQLKNLIGSSSLYDDCVFEIVVTPHWNDEEKFTIARHPLIGRFLLVRADKPVTSVKVGVFSYNGVARVLQRNYKATVVNNVTRVVTVNTQGSGDGRIVMSGCGKNLKFDYTKANPQVELPLFSSTCELIGQVLPLDKPNDMEFVIAVDVVPSSYLFLALPGISDDGSNIKLQLDPAVSLVDVNGRIYFGNNFKVKKKDVGGTYYVRQITIIGRQSISLVKDGVIQWTMQ